MQRVTYPNIDGVGQTRGGNVRADPAGFLGYELGADNHAAAISAHPAASEIVDTPCDVPNSGLSAAVSAT